MLKLLAREGVLRRIVEAASAAPSIHNTQPWRFVVAADDALEVRADPGRALRVADPRGRAMYLSCGAALYNIRVAIRMTGFNPIIWLLPHPQDPDSRDLLAIVQAEPGRPASFAEREQYEAIWHRHTNRGPFTDEPLPESVRMMLEQAAGFEFATLRMLTEREAMAVLGLAEQASAELAGDAGHQAELQRWITAGSRDDGIPVAALPPRPRREPAPVRAGDLTSAAPSEDRAASEFERLPHLAVLTTARDEPIDWLRAGQALQRVLLVATAHGLSASFLYQPVELRDMRGEGAPAWPWPGTTQIIIRFGYGGPTVVTPRRAAEDVLAARAGASSGRG